MLRTTRAVNYTKRNMTTLTFAQTPSFKPTSHLILGSKSLLDASSLKSTGLDEKDITVHKHVAAGTVEDAAQWVESGESAVKVTFANLSVCLVSLHLLQY